MNNKQKTLNQKTLIHEENTIYNDKKRNHENKKKINAQDTDKKLE